MRYVNVVVSYSFIVHVIRLEYLRIEKSAHTLMPNTMKFRENFFQCKFGVNFSRSSVYAVRNGKQEMVL